MTKKKGFVLYTCTINVFANKFLSFHKSQTFNYVTSRQTWFHMVHCLSFVDIVYIHCLSMILYPAGFTFLSLRLF